MIASTLALGFLGLAAASPIAERQIVPHYPQKSLSKGFRLVLNVTDPARDLSPSVKNTYITSIHVGAGLNYVGNVEGTEAGRIFYQNGTGIKYATVNTISDGGSPAAPYSFALTKDAADSKVSTATLNVGQASDNIGLTGFPNPYTYLYPETYAACNEPLAYYGGKNFVIIKQAQLSVDKNGVINYNIPKECVPVRLLPECTKLNDLPAGSLSSHAHALDSECYDDIKSIDWTQYGP